MPLVLLLLVLWACHPRAVSQTGTGGERLTLVFTSDTKGRVGDCGCSHNPLGGLERRATLLDSLRRSLPGPLWVLDLGNRHGLARNEAAHGDARLIDDCLLAMDYDLLLPGPIEHALPDSLRRNLQASLDESGRLGRWELLDGAGQVLGMRDTGTSVRITRWIDGEWRLNSTFALETRAFPAAPPAPGADLELLVAFCDPDSLRLRPERLRGWDLVLLGGSTSPLDRAETTAEGTVLFAARDRGRSLAVITLERTRDGRWRLESAAHLDVRPETAPDPGITALIGQDRHTREQARLGRIEQRRLAVRQELGLPPDPDTLRHVGGEACAACHAPQAAHWATDRHAGLYAELLRRPGRITPERERRFVTGWLRPGGFLDLEHTPERLNVQCEACHGPGQRHATDPTLPLPVSDPGRSCLDCHDSPPALPYHR